MSGEEEKILDDVTQRVHKPAVKPPEPISEEELKAFTLGLIDGRVFTSAHVGEADMLPMIFMPLGLGMFADHGDKELKAIDEKLGVFWEWMDRAGPRSVNGYPCFFSVRMLCKSDWERARKAYKDEMDRRKNFTLPPA